MQERRSSDRSRTFLAGTLFYRARSASVPCVVRNMSRGGAMLLVDEPQRVTSETELTLTGQGTDRARVAWRGDAAVGVVFLDEERAAPAVEVQRANVIPFPGTRRDPSPADDGARLAERIARFVKPN